MASAVVRVTAPAVIKVSTGGLVDVTKPLMDLLKENPQAVASKTSDRLAAYEKAQELLNDLSIALLDVARDLAKSKNGLPLVIVIDELDRCRPSYAVELLEAAKHIFAVDKIVFVLAVNRTELAHSVRALYGAKFDAIGYLNRFFDVDFQLPNPARTQFIETALEVTSINEYFQNMTYQHTNPYHPPFKELLEAFYGVPGISIRTIAQAIHRLGLALASERTYRPLFVLSTVVALIIRTVDLKLYQRFIRGESVDEEVVDSIYDRAEYADVHWRIKAHFDAAIIVAAWEMSDSYVAIDRITDSPLLARYRQMIEQQSQHEGPRTEDVRL